MKDPWDIQTYREFCQHLDPLPPLDDEEAESRYHARYPWAFDKYEQLNIYGSTEHGLDRVPDSIQRGICQTPSSPGDYIIKPRWNPGGLAHGVRHGTIAGSREIWQRRYYGEHWSLDIPIIDGLHVPTIAVGIGIQDESRLGHFLAWKIRPFDRRDNIRIQTHIHPFAKLLQGFRGVINMEFIRSDDTTHLLEMHLRPSVEFWPIYDDPCVRSIFEFYAGVRSATLRCERGSILVEPRYARTLDLEPECWENSWRKRLHYICHNEE